MRPKTTPQHWAKSIPQLIGNTPLVQLQRLAPDLPATLLAKLEMFNPGGSHKDRVALHMIDDAENQGLLRPGQHPPSTIIEPTSGNMGISLAWLSAARGYTCILTMPDTVNLERRLLLERFGARVILTPANQGMRGAINRALELRNTLPHTWSPQQFNNPANPAAHRQTTALEIWRDTGGAIDIIIIGVGTGGTLTGVAQALRTRKPTIQVIAVEPASCAILSGRPPGPHHIEGLGPGFRPDTLDLELIDHIIPVTDQHAITTAIHLLQREGLSAGISSGAVAWASLQVARKAENRGKVILTIFPSAAERHLHTILFDDLRHPHV